MQDIASFSDLLSQLNPFFRSPAGGSADVTAPSPSDTPAVISGPSTPPTISPDTPGESFDTAPLPPGEQAGVYKAPTVAVAQRQSMSFDFQFELSIRQETRVASPGRGERSSGSFALAAREQTNLSYQSLQSLFREGAAGSFREVRTFQAQMFRSRTRQLSSRLDRPSGERLDRTAGQVSRTFELNIKLEASFLSQFVRQAEDISEMDSDVFQQYLDGTDRFSGGSGEPIQAFFDQVDGLLADTEAFVKETLSTFFDEITASFGMSDQEANSLQDLVIEEVTAFFQDVDRFLDNARSALAMPAEEPQLPESEPQPATVQAALLQP